MHQCLSLLHVNFCVLMSQLPRCSLEADVLSPDIHIQYVCECVTDFLMMFIWIFILAWIVVMCIPSSYSNSNDCVQVFFCSLFSTGERKRLHTTNMKKEMCFCLSEVWNRATWGWMFDEADFVSRHTLIKCLWSKEKRPMSKACTNKYIFK